MKRAWSLMLPKWGTPSVSRGEVSMRSYQSTCAPKGRPSRPAPTVSEAEGASAGRYVNLRRRDKGASTGYRVHGRGASAGRYVNLRRRDEGASERASPSVFLEPVDRPAEVGALHLGIAQRLGGQRSVARVYARVYAQYTRARTCTCACVWQVRRAVEGGESWLLGHGGTP